MRGWLFAMALMAAADPVLADDLPIAPPSPMVDPHGGTSIGKGPALAAFVLGGFRGQFETTKLEKVRAAVGAGVVQTIPGQDSLDYLCYDLPSVGARVWLAVTDEMGNAGVDSVTVKPLEPSDPKSRTCPALPARFGPVSIDGNVHLGMSRKDLVRVLGQPSLDTGGWLVFRGWADDSQKTVTVRLDRDKVVFLYASSTSTD